MKATHDPITPDLLRQIVQRLQRIQPDDRPQKVIFAADSLELSWQPPHLIPHTQHALGMPRLTLERYGRKSALEKITVSVVTSAALDLANMLNGDWNPAQPHTLKLGQITRLLSVADWVLNTTAQSVAGEFSAATVVEGAYQTEDGSAGGAKPAPANRLVGVLPFEIARVCAGYLIITFQLDQLLFQKNAAELWSAEKFSRLNPVVI